MISFQPTCYDESTVMIMMTMTIEYYSNVSIEGVIEREINKSDSSIFYMHSGLAICINPDCQLEDEVNNSSTTTEKSFNENSVSQIVGPVVGVLCGIIVLLLIIITLIWVINKRYKYLFKRLYVTIFTIRSLIHAVSSLTFHCHLMDATID